MRLLQVISDTDRRGAQIFAVELGGRLAESGHDVRTVALASGGRGGLDVAALGARRFGLSTLIHLRKAMRAADITIAHGSSTLPACAIAGFGGDRRWIYRQISDPLYWAGTRAQQVRVRAWYRQASHVVVLTEVSSAVLEQSFNVPRDRMTVIPNGVDERRFRPVSEDERQDARDSFGLGDNEFVVGFAGALTEEKGIAELLAALRVECRLLVAGDGPARRGLADDPRVILLGVVDDLRPLYAAIDVLALPSWTEQQPAVVLEAGMCGVPSVVSDVGDLRTMLDDGRAGWLVPPRRIESLRIALAEAADDPAVRFDKGSAAAGTTVRRHAMAAVADRWRSLLEPLARHP